MRGRAPWGAFFETLMIMWKVWWSNIQPIKPDLRTANNDSNQFWNHWYFSIASDKLNIKWARLYNQGIQNAMHNDPNLEKSQIVEPALQGFFTQCQTVGWRDSIAASYDVLWSTNRLPYFCQSQGILKCAIVLTPFAGGGALVLYRCINHLPPRLLVWCEADNYTCFDR